LICIETGLCRDGPVVRWVYVEKGCGDKVCVEAVTSKSSIPMGRLCKNVYSGVDVYVLAHLGARASFLIYL